MRKNNFFSAKATSSVAALLLLAACSINVKNEPNGQDKQVDVKTFAGNIHVSNQPDAADVGLAVYPGARLREKNSGDDKTANVNISSFGYGIKVVALEYESSDAPAKVVSFYKAQMKKYGDVLDCRTGTLHVNVQIHSKNDSNQLTCDTNDSGKDFELKVGTREDQHIVAVEPNGNGSSFSLVHVRTHGKDADI